jgi:gamma-glutamylcyclotransferase
MARVAGKNDMSELYFAYGSNLWIEQMAKRLGPISLDENPPRRALLSDYRLIFNTRGEEGHVFANIQPPGKGVLGVVYCCSPEALTLLDEYEQGYERRRVFVTAENGEQLEVFTYIAEPPNVVPGRKPTTEYLRRIVTGATQHGLPEAYILELIKEGETKRWP